MTKAMSTFDSGKESLQDLLQEIGDAKIQLPDFQRDWRWDDDHIRSLLASVSLSYPIGAVLLMETGRDGARFAPRRVAGVNNHDGKTPDRLILDGQQRLTALFQVLRSGQAVSTRDSRNRPLKRWYYIDIDVALDPTSDREDAIVSLPEDRIIVQRRQIIADYSDMAKETAAGMFPLQRVFDVAGLFKWLDLYTEVEDNEIRVQRKELRDRMYDEIISRIQQYQIPVIELKKETPKEAVCQVFEKVNTGGVSLTVFELVTASFAADGYRLRDDWDKKQRDLRQKPPLRNLASNDFLMAATLLASWYKRQEDGRSAVSCKRRDILRLTLDDYKRVADPLVRGFKEAARFLIREKMFSSRDLPYQTQLVPLAAILTALGSDAELESVKQRIARWFWCGVFGELYGSSVESRFAKDIPEVLEWIQGGAEPSTVQESHFTPPRLLSLRTRNSAAYKGLSAVLMREGGRDFRTGDTLELATYFDDSVDIHHIFPKRVCEKLGIAQHIYNGIANKTPLSSRTNRIIGGRRPSEYLSQLEKEFHLPSSNLDDILESHLIDPLALRKDDFDGFFAERTTSLLGLIEHATGKTVLQAVEDEEDPEIAEQEDLDEWIQEGVFQPELQG